MPAQPVTVTIQSHSPCTAERAWHPRCVSTNRMESTHMKHINFHSLAIVSALILITATPALAQRESRRAPHQASSAVEGEVGVFMPTQSGMSAGPTIEGAYEYYLTARNSLRLGTGWTNPKTG